MISLNSLQNPTTFLRIWMISGATTVVVPLIVFGAARLANSGGNDQNQNGDNNGEGNGGNNCRWYQFGCSDNNDNQEQGSGDRQGAPWWWFGARDERRAEDSASPALILCYVWSIVLFAVILRYGSIAVNGGNSLAVISSLVIFANLCFLMMVLLQGVDGVVEVEGRQVEENGFIGQMGVLMFMTYFLWLLFSLVFVYLIRLREQRSNVTTVEISPSDYQVAPDEKAQMSAVI